MGTVQTVLSKTEVAGETRSSPALFQRSEARIPSRLGAGGSPRGWQWLSGTHAQLAAVWRSYGIVVQPRAHDIVHGAAVYLVDARGYERAGYLAPLLPNFLALDIRRVEADTTPEKS